MRGGTSRPRRRAPRFSIKTGERVHGGDAGDDHGSVQSRRRSAAQAPHRGAEAAYSAVFALEPVSADVACKDGESAADRPGGNTEPSCSSPARPARPAPTAPTAPPAPPAQTAPTAPTARTAPPAQTAPPRRGRTPEPTAPLVAPDGRARTVLTALPGELVGQGDPVLTATTEGTRSAAPDDKRDELLGRPVWVVERGDRERLDVLRRRSGSPSPVVRRGTRWCSSRTGSAASPSATGCSPGLRGRRCTGLWEPAGADESGPIEVDALAHDIEDDDDPKAAVLALTVGAAGTAGPHRPQPAAGRPAGAPDVDLIAAVEASNIPRAHGSPSCSNCSPGRRDRRSTDRRGPRREAGQPGADTAALQRQLLDPGVADGSALLGGRVQRPFRGGRASRNADLSPRLQRRGERLPGLGAVAQGRRWRTTSTAAATRVTGTSSRRSACSRTPPRRSPITHSPSCSSPTWSSAPPGRTTRRRAWR